MNVSGNYKTTQREIAIVKTIFDNYEIAYESISKYEKTDDGDILVTLPNGKKIVIEVKEETYARFIQYGDLGIDFLSAFSFDNPNDERKWKGAPKRPYQLPTSSPPFCLPSTSKNGGKSFIPNRIYGCFSLSIQAENCTTTPSLTEKK